MSDRFAKISDLVDNGDILEPSGKIKSFTVDHGAAGDGVTDDTAAVNAALAANKRVFDNGDFLVTNLVNDYGAQIEGDVRILKADAYINQQINSYADKYQRIFGQEYLSVLHKRLLANSAVKIILSGDSTTAGSGASSSTYHPKTILENLTAKHKINNITYVDSGIGGQNTGTWLSTYLAADLAQNPHVLILRWGINDSITYTPHQFLDNLNTGLASIRANANFTMDKLSIVLQSPTPFGSTFDSHKGQIFNEAINLGLRALARKHHCCFIDIYGTYQDSQNGADYLQPTGGGTGSVNLLHPRDTLYVELCTLTFNVLFPDYYRPSQLPTGGSAGQFLAYDSTWKTPPGVGDKADRAVSDTWKLNDQDVFGNDYFAIGVTIERASGGAWPVDGVLTTTRTNALGGLGQQTLVQWGGGPTMYVRGGYFASWTSWKQITLT